MKTPKPHPPGFRKTTYEQLADEYAALREAHYRLHEKHRLDKKRMALIGYAAGQFAGVMLSEVAHDPAPLFSASDMKSLGKSLVWLMEQAKPYLEAVEVTAEEVPTQKARARKKNAPPPPVAKKDGK